MLLLPLTLAIFKLSLSAAADSVQESGLQTKKDNDAHRVFKSYSSPLAKLPFNLSSTFLSDNELKVPMRLEYKLKKKSVKKSPKRTIQRIIKKSKMKARKMYLNQVTNAPTQPPENLNYDNNNMALENQSERDMTTTQASQKKKVKRWSAKRYPMPFQKFNTHHDGLMHHRIRRDADRDLYILEDLDEAVFLSDEDGNAAVKTNVKNYW